ncbi:DNA-binding transcriptional LysR family regulator [Archangium gephyra]|uniref:DNA-binding transcriptional LysR family regulator n=1 Tax=Archangium gephyra TaxID=48 RepID=A0AAC8Q180_9BACT|nr:LysR family transcriptional regulator [Archangium gephyra]AKI98508.1 Transcriptional regulator, LysR family [Archangium gephyra]REG20394.1 DNA-binding transcriptional LysR family regulator [Archangium gephyra]
MGASLDDLVAMTVFARVVEAHSFSGAAARLGLSKSAVSTRVAALERRLGVRLLHRTTRSLSVTPEGAQLYERCAHLLSVADEASDLLGNVGTIPEGTVRVVAPVGLSLHPLPSLLEKFAGRYPRVQVELSVSDRRVDPLTEGVDVALRLFPPPQERSLIERRLGTEKRLVCGSPAYFARRAPPDTPHELASHNCLRLKDSKWDFRLEGRTTVVPVSGTLVVDDIAVLREAALEGLGLARLPRSLVDADVREGRLLSVLDAYAAEPLVISLVYPQRKHMPQRVRVFIDFMTEHFRKVFRGG